MDLWTVPSMDSELKGNPQFADPVDRAADSCTTVIPEAMEASKSSLMDKMHTLALLTWQDLNKFWGHLTTTESRISNVEDITASNTHNLLEFQKRLWHNNVWVVGLPEGVEGSHPIFAESFFRQLLNLMQISLTYIVKWAHEVLICPRPTCSPPRPFLVRFLHFWDRNLVLEEARKKPQLQYDNNVL